MKLSGFDPAADSEGRASDDRRHLLDRIVGFRGPRHAVANFEYDFAELLELT
jgi:hypothetical protein